MTPTGAASPDAPHALPGARAEWLRLILAFGSAAVAIVILTAVSWRARAVRQESAQWVMHTQEVQVAVEKLLSSAAEAEAAQREYLITGSAKDLEPFEAAESRVSRQIEELGSLTRDNPVQQQRVAALRTLAQVKAEALRATIALRQRGDAAASRRAGGEAGGIPDQTRLLLSEMRDEETALLARRMERLVRADRFSGLLTIGGAALLVVLLAGAALTVREQMKRRLLQAEERARVLEYQERLIAIVGHDLRSPLTAVLVSAQMLLQRRDDLRASQATAVDRIVRSASRVDALASLLIDFTYARLGKGIPTRPGPMDARAVVERAVEEVRAAQPGREIRMAGPPVAAPGFWDGDRIEQLMVNLLGNAVQYGAPGTPVTVSVAPAAAGGVEITVHNQGSPIAAGLKLFEPYQRGKEAESLHPRGLGLGLFIVREIARAHGGSVSASSGPDGTTFTVLLPARATPAPGDLPGKQAPAVTVEAG